MSIRTTAALALGVAVLATSAQAITLSPARYSAAVKGGFSFNDFAPVGTTHDDTFGTASAWAGDSPVLKVGVDGASGPLGGGQIAEASISYKFAVLSAFPGSVHILINGAAQAFGSGNYFSEGGVDLFGSTGATVAWAHKCHASPGCNSINQVGTSGGPRAVTVNANEAYQIRLYASGGTFDANSSFNAWADPTITFDPDYAAPQGATFAFSPGIPVARVDAGGVPEPATWAMMLMGFGGLGAMLRRRRSLPLAA